MKIYKLTNTQMLLALVGMATAACVSVVLVIQAPQLTINGSYPATAESLPLSQPLQAKVTSVAMSDVMPVQASTPSESNLPQSLPHTTVRTSWQMGDAKALTPALPLSERISAYTVVELQQSPVHFPAVGEQIEMPLLNGQKVIANVQSTVTNPNGDTTWSGHLAGYGDDYPVVMTYGEHSIFATITTPDGSYTMESLDGLGWLYKNPAEIELSDPGAKDFLEIDAPH